MFLLIELLSNLNGLKKLSFLLTLLLMLVLCFNKSYLTIICTTILCLICICATIGEMEKKKNFSMIKLFILTISICIFWAYILFQSEEAKLELHNMLTCYPIGVIIPVLICITFIIYCICFITKTTFEKKNV